MRILRYFPLAALVAAFPVLARETVLEDSPSRLTLEVEVSSGYNLTTGLDGSRILSAGFASMGKAGGPDLPWYSFQVASGAQSPSVSIEPEEWVDVSLPQGLASIPHWLTPTKPETQKDASLFASAGSLTSRTSAIQKFRGMTFRSITFPIGTYAEGSGRAHMLKRFRVQVTFADARSTPDTRTREWLLQAGIKNVQGGQYLTTLPRPAALSRKAVTSALGTTHLKIRIGDRQVDGLAEDGVYSLKYETVRDAIGLSGISGVRIEYLRMYGGPKDSLPIINDSTLVAPTLREIPIQVTDNNNNGTFDEGDGVVFYAHGTSVWNPDPGESNVVRWRFAADPYSFENDYYLDWSSPSVSGSRLTQRAAHAAVETDSIAPHYLRAEHDVGTGSTDLSGRFDPETGYDWYWAWKDFPSKTLSGTQVKSSTTDTIKGYAGDSVWIGVFDYPGKSDSIFTLWSGGGQLRHVPVIPNLYGSWYTQSTLTNERLGLDSIGWADFFGSSPRFEGYTVRYMRNLKWNGQDRIVFPAATGKWVAYKIRGATTGMRCLRIETGVGARWLPLQVNSGDTVFTDSAGVGEDVQYLLYASTRNVDASAVIAEQIHLQDGMVQNYSTGNGVTAQTQYLIIAPEALLSEAVKLRNFRQDAKHVLPLATSVMRTEDIYREWSGGRLSPMAIRNAIRWATNQPWGSQIRYVLLYGDGNFDYRNLRNSANPPANHIPPFNWDDVNFGNFTNPMSTDDFYGVLGAGTHWTNGLLDVALGRLPVQTLEQARNYLDKISRYEDPATAGVWRSRVTLAADDATQHGNNNGDIDVLADKHTSESEAFGKTILGNEPGIRMEKVYLFDYIPNSNFLKPEAQTDLINNLNQGTLLVNFFGHGAYNQWADEQMMKTNDAMSRFRNADQNFMVTVFSCTVGRFEMLADEGMVEQYVRQKDYGAIAGLGATRESYPDDNSALGSGVVKRLFSPDSLPILQGVGLAVQNAKNAIGNGSSYNKQKYVFFGEPTVVIRRPGPKISLDSASLPDTLRALQCGTFRGRVPGGSGHGFISVRIQAGDVKKDYPFNPGVIKHGPVLFERTTGYKDSTFSMGYFLPKQVPFGDSTAKIQFFAWDAEKPMETSRAVGGFWITGTAAHSACSATDDGKGPKITVTGCNVKESGAVNFPDHVKISLPYCLQIDVIDSSGGVMSGQGPDEGTTVEVTGVIDPFHPQPGTDDLYHKSYQVTLQNGQMSTGTHLLKVTARDGFGNLGLRQLSLEASTDTVIRFVNAFNAPNPMKRNGTAFYFSTTLPQDLGELGEQGHAPNSNRVSFDLRIYNQLGYMVQEFRNAQSGMRWDGKDAWGQNLANGVYFYQVTASWDETNGAPTHGVKTSLRNTLVLSR